MATTTLRQQPHQDLPECFSFTLILSGFDEITPEIEDALYAAGCDDALLAMRAESPYLAFDREAPTFEDAIKSAIKNVEGCGLGIQVLRVIPSGAEAMETINAYLGMRQQLRAQMPTGLSPEIMHKIDEVLAAVLEKNPAAISHALSDK